ncbi:uncharacterized protein LOC110007110 [Amborella trichopoda]|uniref:uncharacterized protein LOC110007110 n=1 Tax=Amborella trichopoda TaxID=13333 RepID=UPI0009BFE8F5|nr:uncharacterized protein LOC110007110 [Amborella trichopoda]|eukprot:XP_020521896.1 uncharacterized protein LOC110007110 [Amborella trichopoda]
MRTDEVLTCKCWNPTKLRISNTEHNRKRLFYNCSQVMFKEQCNTCHWCDDMTPLNTRHAEELQKLQVECALLYEENQNLLRMMASQEEKLNGEIKALRKRIELASAEGPMPRLQAWHLR